MVSTAPEDIQQTAIALQGEQRVVIHDVTWEGYLQILDALPQTRSTRLIYDEGTLEFTMPTEDHDFSGRMIGLFIRVLVRGFGKKIKTMGSTTLNFPGLKKGAEPDEAFYIQNQPLVSGRNVDLEADPAPDLIVEVDITNTDIDKNRLYASMNVPEFWRFDGYILRIYQLQNRQYVEVETSPTFPTVPKEWLYDFLEQCRQDELAAEDNLRDRLHQHLA